MKSIADLRHALQTHSAGLSGHRWDPAMVTALWNKMQPSRTMPKRRSTYKKRGGAAYELQGAELNYAMTPGSAFTTDPTVAVYDRFPIDPTMNPQVVSDLDVFFGSALSRGCGVENTVPQVPADMGSNQVGGTRKRTMKHKGGVAEVLVHRPYLSTVAPNQAQVAINAWQGKGPILAPADPTDPTWSLATDNPIVPTGPTLPASMGASGPIKQWPTTGGGRKSKSKSKSKSRKNKSKSRKNKSKSRKNKSKIRKNRH